VAELRIYESLAVSHYYFGDVQRCNYYLDKFLRGKYEPTTSYSKQSQVLVNQHERDKKGGKFKFTQKTRKGLNKIENQSNVQVMPQNRNTYEMLPFMFDDDEA